MTELHDETLNVVPIGTLASWGKLKPLPEGLPEPPMFSYSLVPVKFRPWIENIADRM